MKTTETKYLNQADGIVLSKPRVGMSVYALKAVADSLTDEIVEQENGRQQYVHHINGDPKNKLVIGSSAKGKSFLPDMNEK